MVKMGESFFTSLGFDPLPATFWERSQLTRPRDREVVCHASAWDVTWSDDLRIKMCIEPTEENLVTIHHELGHDFYFSQYYKLPILFQQGANDGFHEGIGDTIALSVTPQYLKTRGILASAGGGDHAEKSRINEQMKKALEKVAFLPFGLRIDKWRWDVFSGKVAPDQYNASWWAGALEVPGHRAARAAHGGGLRPGGEVPRRELDPLRAQLPLVHLPIPVPPRAVQGGGLHRAARSVLDLPEHRRGPEAARDALDGGGQAVARRDGGLERRAAGRRERHPRVLRAAPRLAQGPDQGREVRVVDAVVHAAGAHPGGGARRGARESAR